MAVSRAQRLVSVRCDELRRLADGWNGPDSRAPTAAALAAAESVAGRVDVDVDPDDDGGVWVTVDGRRVLHVGAHGEVA